MHRARAIPNGSSPIAYALYSVANGKFVQSYRPRMMSAAARPRPLPGQGGALSATGRPGATLRDPSPTYKWFWTNASGTS